MMNTTSTAIATREVEDEPIDRDLTPPACPTGYVLYKGQKLKQSAWLPGNTFPTFHVIQGWRYARKEDLVKGVETRADRGVRHYRCPSEEEAPLEVVIHQALVRQYVYTGSYDEDLQVLHMYLERFEKAIRSLETFVPAKRDAAAEKWDALQQIRIAKDALVAEIVILRTEIDDGLDDDAYLGFDEFDLGLPRLPKRRPKGYKWVCRI